MIDPAKQLQSETPSPRRARIMGRLNVLVYENQGFVLQLEDGAKIRGTWMKDNQEPLRALWGKDVLIEGIVRFKPNGDPLSLEAEAVTQAEAQDRFWARLPRPPATAFEAPIRPSQPPAQNPWDLIVGIWPGNESDEEFAELVESLSYAADSKTSDAPDFDLHRWLFTRL